MRHVIVGGGIAGTTAAEELRKLDPDAEITLVNEEHEALYSRVLLPHYAKGVVPREKIFLKKETWYAEQRVEWLAGTRCDAVDVRNAHVELSDGRELPYDRLLVATGGETRTLPYEGENACYFHTLGDTEHLIARMASLGGGRAFVYGGSFIACELLDVFLHRGLATVAAFRGEWMFRRVLDAESGELVSDRLRAAGAELRPGSESVESLGAEAGDLVGIGVGVEPDLAWIRDAGIEANRGVLANARLETSAANVYAAGDVAEFDDVIAGRRLMSGNWFAAQLQGRVAARNMAGAGEEYRNVPSYATKLAGLDVIAVGDTDRASADEIRVVGSRAAGGVTQLFSRGGKVVGATLVGRNQDRAPVTAAIRDGSAEVKLE